MSTVAEKLTKAAADRGLPLVCSCLPEVVGGRNVARYLFSLPAGGAYATATSLKDGLAELARLDSLYGDGLRKSGGLCMVDCVSGELIDIPTRQSIEAMAVGKQAIDPFGKLAEIVEITHVGEDVAGRLFCCYYVEFGTGSRISMTRKEGELTATVALSNHYTSAQLDALAQKLGGARR
jgi:hypothetical protein